MDQQERIQYLLELLEKVRQREKGAEEDRGELLTAVSRALRKNLSRHKVTQAEINQLLGKVHLTQFQIEQLMRLAELGTDDSTSDP